MKNLFILLCIVGISFISCSGQTKSSDNGKSKEINKAKETKMKAIPLNKIDFLKKVANYEADPSNWKYLGDKPAIIDFYADWCGPCKAIAPVLEELAGEYEGEIYVYKVNTEEEQELAALFGIRSIPSLLFVPMDEAPRMAQGAVPKMELKKAIDEILLKK
ncbi:MAG: thioredoxin [Dysgonomonas sp.]